MRISDWSSDVCSSDLQVKIPTGIQSGREIRHRGAGMPVLQGRGRGDLVVRIEVETPTRLNARQKELLEAFRETETGEECPERSEEHTSELQSLMRISYAVFCLKKKKT